MAAAATLEKALEAPARRAPRGRTSARPRALLRLVPGAEGLLHPRAAEALVLASRPLSPGR